MSIVRIFIVLPLVFALKPLSLRADEAAADKDFGAFYDRVAADILAGKPLVMTAYVALCDNDSQGIMPVRNKKICMGDKPEENLYWATTGGLKGHLRGEGWRKVLYESFPNDTLAARGIWKKRFYAGGALRDRGVKGSIEVYIVGLAYRGVRIRQALVDYLTAVVDDKEETVTLKDGKLLTIGGRGHLVGYIGHDYFMDDPDVENAVADPTDGARLQKGVFALSCMSDEFFRPSIQRAHTHLLALNRDFTFPSAFTAVGIVRAVAAGMTMKGVHREAAKAFAKGQKKSVGTMLRALVYGDKPL